MSESETIQTVMRIVRETLALPDSEEVSGEQLLVDDLGFTSMDMVDLLFRVEEEFGVSIDAESIYSEARGDLREAEFCCDGVLTDAGRERLMKLLPETPAQMFPAEVGAQTLARYCSVAAVARFVERARAHS
jgi:acyl carrier protein